jgi:excisionase family DNA binding protein
MAEPWVPVEQLASYLACSVDGVNRCLALRGLPGHRVDRVWRFKVSEVDVWVRADGANEHPDKAAG